jgi:replicative DNA helicase
MAQKKYSKPSTSSSTSLELGKIPPQAIELEEVVIGGLMLEKDAIIEVVDILSPESFYKEVHQIIYSTIIELFSHSKAIDILTVLEKLRQKKELESVGGPVVLTQLTSRVASAAHIEFHARIIQQKFMQRELIRISSELQNRAFDESVDVNELIDFADNEIFNIRSGNIKKMGKKLWEIGRKRLEELEKICASEDKKTGITSFRKLDRITGGWQDANLIIIGARPAMGKTRIAQELAKLADVDGASVIFSLEMIDYEIYDRELSSRTGIENMYIRQADFNPDDWKSIEKAQRDMEKLDILIDDTPTLTPAEFRAKAKQYVKKHGVKLIILDYLQLMHNPEYKFNREQEISSISRSLKATAKELKIPIIALSQLNRSVENRPDKRPNLSDLRESGAIEQDADIITFIHRPAYYEIENQKSDENKNLIEFILAKYRGGAIGTIKLWHTDRWERIVESKSDLYPHQSEINEEEPF